MKQSPLATVLLLILVVLTLLSPYLCWRLMTQSRALRNLQAQVNAINQRQNAVNALANEALEYSKKNPAIDPILEFAGLRLTNKPASK